MSEEAKTNILQTFAEYALGADFKKKSDAHRAGVIILWVITILSLYVVVPRLWNRILDVNFGKPDDSSIQAQVTTAHQEIAATNERYTVLMSKYEQLQQSSERNAAAMFKMEAKLDQIKSENDIRFAKEHDARIATEAQLDLLVKQSSSRVSQTSSANTDLTSAGSAYSEEIPLPPGFRKTGLFHTRPDGLSVEVFVDRNGKVWHRGNDRNGNLIFVPCDAPPR